jgi:hypothetical protein
MNLWHAVHPLFFIGLICIGAGIAAFREKNRKSRPVGVFFALSGLFLVILTGKDLVIGPPADVAAVRNADPDRIVAFEIGPLLGEPSSGDLVSRTIRVTDRAQIARLVTLLRASTYASPNHPRGGWNTKLVLDDGRERHEAKVMSTSDGLLIEIGSAGVGHEFRNEELKGFLESVAEQKK